MKIFLTNTLSKKKEEFQPIEEGQVKIYSCGPTVYDFVHIGNLRAYAFADILKRMFLMNGYEVNHVMNITDVGHLASDADEGEDKLEKGAARENKTVWEVADFYIQAFLSDAQKLNLIEPDTLCRATDHIAQMIKLIKGLEEKGYTYVANGNVYFDTAKYPAYGQLGNLKLSPEELQSRVEADPDKKSPLDFVLWFTRYKYSDHAMKWESPWGVGFPGWHIECSAMSMEYLGDRIDVHTGGIDLSNIHHTNEIAQSECFLGHKWVNYWLHNEFIVTKEGAKMSKSKDNFATLSTIEEKGYDALDYRYFLLTAQYSKPLSFDFEGLDSARNSRQRLKNIVRELRKAEAGTTDAAAIARYEDEFLTDANDDLNTPKCLAVMWKTLDDASLSAKDKLELLAYYDELFGLKLLDAAEEDIPEEVQVLAAERWQAKQDKDWSLSDQKRAEIEARGYEVLDGKDGYEVRKR